MDDDLDFESHLYGDDDGDLIASGTDDDGASGFYSDDSDQSGQTVSEMMAAAANTPTGSPRRMEKMLGRLGFGGSATESNSRDARLSSVVSESTPGPALDLLRSNRAFALPGLDAWVMLVLPTTGDFGGLNKRVRSEAKGQFIQMINTELIDAVVTNELLADDALGLVPTMRSLQRMKEFGILTGARYIFAVACADVDSGGVKIFSVPAVEEEDGTVGKVFAKVETVAAGQAPLSSLVDPRVAAAMLAIYRNPDLDPGEGDRLLGEAVQANVGLMVDEVARGRYPTPGEIVANLDQKFPSAGIKGAAAKARGSADEPVPAVRIDTPVPDEGETGQDDRHSGDDTDPEEGSGGMSHDQADASDSTDPSDNEPDFTDAEDADDAGGDTATDEADGLDFSAASVEKSGASSGISDEAGMRAIFSAIEALRQDVRTSVEHTTSGVPVGVPGKAGPVDVVVGSEFTYEQALESAGRRYINDELELYVDPAPFVQRLTWSVPSLDVPVTGVTPWLGEQVQTWIGVLDQNIKAHHEESVRNLYRRYTQLADRAAAATNAEFDPRHNTGSQWGKAFAALERDRLSLADRMSSDRLAAEGRAREQWEIRRKSYVDDAAARAGQDFDHRNAARIEADVRDAGERIIAGGEALHERNLAEFNEMRRRAAHEFMDAQLSQILAQLDEEAAAMQRMNTEMVEAAVASVEGYLDEHRQKDLERAEIDERKLEADTRLEQARKEASEEIAKIRKEADDRVAAMAEDVRRRADETVEQLRINNETNQLQVGREEARVRSLESQLSQAMEESDRRAERLEVQYEQELEAARRDAQRARADQQSSLADQRRRSSVVFWTMAIGIILAVILGGLAGFVLANGVV